MKMSSWMTWREDCRIAVVQEAAEEARKAKSSFSSTWERALIDGDLGFCIADEENFKPGMDRLKVLTETFLLEPQVGRRILGRAWSAPTRKKLFQWKKTTSPCCPWCEGREESWVHVQLARWALLLQREQSHCAGGDSENFRVHGRGKQSGKPESKVSGERTEICSTAGRDDK
mmetsp:Transcript_17372/g.57514  ORF Transcript_17372/g.57514 Transcript_17372/m.57514 type:complete len:173 (-) Transcript_17372:773-1291(-)